MVELILYAGLIRAVVGCVEGREAVLAFGAIFVEVEVVD